MAALQCEICGGKLVGKPGGLFECEYCGMEYNTDWAKAKIQEIKGTVKVEGTVEVTGTVKLDGPIRVEGNATIANYIKKGKMELADENWRAAGDAFTSALNIDAENIEANFGAYMASSQCRSVDDFYKRYVECGEPDDVFYRRAKQYFSLEQQQMLSKLDAEHEQFQRDKELKEREDERKAQELKKQRGHLLQTQGKIVRQQNALARKHIAFVGGWSWRVFAGLRADGTIQIIDHYGENSEWKKVEKWRNIVAISGGDKWLAGLTTDGCCYVFTGKDTITIYDGQDAIAISVGKEQVAILRANGQIYVYGTNSLTRINNDLSCTWSDIVAIEVWETNLMGLTKDGEIKVTKPGSNRSPGYWWEKVVAIGIDGEDYFGLNQDGTLCVDWKYQDSYYSNPLIDWHDICAFQMTNSLGTSVVGWMPDGSMRTTDENIILNKCKDVVAVCCAKDLCVGLAKNGTLRVVSEIREEKPILPDNVTEAKLDEMISKWKLFSSIDTLESERESARTNRAEKDKQEEKENRKAILAEENDILRTELSGLKGLFSGVRRRQIEARLAEIETELKGLR